MKAMLSKYKNIDRSGGVADIESKGAAKRQRVHQDALERNNVVTISFNCREGSVTHYYHFFFGALIPLIEYHLANPDKSFRVVTDVGPFKRLLCEIPITILELLGPDFSSRFHDDKSISRTREPGEIALKGYDTFNSEYYLEPFFPKPPPQVISRVLNFFETSLPSYIKLLPIYDVLLIQRAQDNYYDSGCRDRTAVYRTSGSQRRSITNHQELADALYSKFGGSFSNIVLERSSIYYQYYMFSRAKIVIAQHGASLANIFFMTKPDAASDSSGIQGANSVDCNAMERSKPWGAHVIEISPPWSREFSHFRNLADYCRVSHESIEQVEDHSAVDIGLVMRAVEICAQKQGIPSKHIG